MTASNPEPAEGVEESTQGQGEGQGEQKPAAKRREETIEIPGYGKVPTAEVAKHYDPDCPRRCDTGSRKAGRPFMGRVVFVRELCDCAVGGYVAAHPLQAEPEPIVAGAVARAAAAGAPKPVGPGQNPRGEQVRRLRARIDELRAELHAIHAEVGERLAPVSDEIAAAEVAASARGATLDSLQADLHGVRQQIAALVDRETVLIRQVIEAETDSAEAHQTLRTHRARADEIRGSRAREERHVAKQIERVERRIAAIVLRHPEAGNG